MDFSIPIAFTPLDQLVPLAQAAERLGFARITLPDSLFYPRTQDKEYPYTPDGSRMWDENTPWVEPFIGAMAMAQATSTIRMCPSVVKFGPRQPLLLYRQAATLALLSGNRLDLGVGIGWDPNEFEWCGVPFAERGARVDEMLDIFRIAGEGEFFTYSGKHFEFDEMSLAPVPSQPIPLYIGGHTKKALSRAARVGMGWTSAMIEFDQLTDVIATLDENLRAGGRSLADRGDGAPFAIQVVSMDKYGTAGFADLASAGVTDVIVMPWMMSGLGFDAPVEDKIATMETFADKYIRA